MPEADTRDQHRARVGLEGELERLHSAVPPPDELAMEKVRREVLGQLSLEGRLEGRRAAGSFWFRGQAWGRLAASLLVGVVLGFLLGKAPERGELGDRLLLALEQQITGAKGTGATAEAPRDDGHELADRSTSGVVEGTVTTDIARQGSTPILASHIEVRSAPGGVLLSFDLGVPMELVRPIDDPLTQEILRQALLGGAGATSRLEALRWLRPGEESILALAKVARSDPEEMVRAEAVRYLVRQGESWMPPGFLEERLRQEPSLAVRWLAFDALWGEGASADGALRTRLFEAAESAAGAGL